MPPGNKDSNNGKLALCTGCLHAYMSGHPLSHFPLLGKVTKMVDFVSQMFQTHPNDQSFLASFRSYSPTKEQLVASLPPEWQNIWQDILGIQLLTSPLVWWQQITKKIHHYWQYCLSQVLTFFLTHTCTYFLNKDRFSSVKLLLTGFDRASLVIDFQSRQTWSKMLLLPLARLSN